MTTHTRHIPANLGAGLHGAIVIDLHIVIGTVTVVLQVEGVKRQPNQVARGDGDVPGAVGTVGVVGRVAGACDGA